MNANRSLAWSKLNWSVFCFRIVRILLLQAYMTRIRMQCKCCIRRTLYIYTRAKLFYIGKREILISWFMSGKRYCDPLLIILLFEIRCTYQGPNLFKLFKLIATCFKGIKTCFLQRTFLFIMQYYKMYENP